MRFIPSSICVALTLGLLASCSSAPSPKTVGVSLALQKDKDKGQDESKRGADAPLLEQANQYARDGLYREALQSFHEFLDKNPNDPAAHRTVGIIYVKTGVYKKAIQHLNKAVATYPNNFELNFYLGEAMRMQNRYADGIYHYKRALEADPKNTDALKALAWSYYNIRFYSEAIRTAKQLRQITPDDFQVSIILARVLNKTDMNDKALAMLGRTEALTSAENLPFLNSVKGDILFSMGDKAGAEQAYRKALQDQPLLPGALVGLARKLIDDKKPSNDTAITYLDRALKIRPNLIEAYYLLGKAHQKLNPQKALEYYKVFVKEATYDPSFQSELAEIKPQLLEARKVTNASKRNDPVAKGGEEQL